MSNRWITDLQKLRATNVTQNDILFIKLLQIKTINNRTTFMEKTCCARIYYDSNNAFWYIYDELDNIILIKTDKNEHELGHATFDNDNKYVIAAVKIISLPKMKNNYSILTKYTDEQIINVDSKKMANSIKNILSKINLKTKVHKTDT